jgi:hypothetical protein
MANRKWRRVIGAGIALLFLGGALTLIKSKPESWNDIARVAAIESLAERGTWSIDHSLWVDATKDKVLIGGKFYSDKMPALTLIGAGVYAILRFGFGASLAPDCQRCAYPWLTLILVAVPAALMLWLFFDHALRRAVPVWIAAIGILALGLGTLLFPFALVFNHHVPAAASLFASFYILTTRDASVHSFRNPFSSSSGGTCIEKAQKTGFSDGLLVAAGFLAALAVSFDVLAGIVAASIAGIALARQRWRWGFFLIGAAIPMLVTALLDYQIAQTILPPYMLTNGYNYPGSAFPATFGGNGTPDDYAAYAFRMFLGGKGLFAYNPLLLFALVGAIGVGLKRKHPLWIEGISTALGFIVLSVYLATQTGNYGGTGYGERWFIPAIPTLCAFIFDAPPLNASTWKHVGWILFAPLLALSAYSSLQGAQAPWQDWLPPLQMTRDVNRFPFFGFKWNVRFP